MTEEQLKELKPGDRLLIHVEVVRHDPKGYGVELATVHPEDGHRISMAFCEYEEAPAIIPDMEEHEMPYRICCFNGTLGKQWSVKHKSGFVVAIFFEALIADAKNEAIKLRDKMNSKNEQSNG